MTVGQQYTLYGNLICIKQVNMFFDKDFVDGMGIAEDKKSWYTLYNEFNFNFTLKIKSNWMFTFYKLNAIWYIVSGDLSEFKSS